MLSLKRNFLLAHAQTFGVWWQEPPGLALQPWGHFPLPGGDGRAGFRFRSDEPCPDRARESPACQKDEPGQLVPGRREGLCGGTEQKDRRHGFTDAALRPREATAGGDRAKLERGNGNTGPVESYLQPAP